MSRLDFIHSKRKKQVKPKVKHQKGVQSIDDIKNGLEQLMSIFQQDNIKCSINFDFARQDYIITWYQYRMGQKEAPMPNKIGSCTFNKKVMYDYITDKSRKQKINNRFNQVTSMNKLFIKTLFHSLANEEHQRDIDE